MSDTNHSTSSGLAAAEADLAARMSGKPPASPAGGGQQPPAATPPAEPAPAPEPPPEPQYPAAPPAPEPTPTPAPPAPPAPEPTPGVAPTPAPATPEPPASPAPEVQDPAARRFLEMHGGDLNKALRFGLDYNNRLGRFARENPDAFAPGGPADPRQEIDIESAIPFEDPGLTPIEEPGPIELDPAEVANEVNSRVYQDPTASGLIQAYVTNKARLEGNPQAGQKGLLTEIDDLQGQINYETHKMQDPDLAPDDLRKGEIESKLLRLNTQLGLLRQEESRLNLENSDYDARFRAHRAAIEEGVVGEFTEEAEEEAFTTYESQMETEEEAKVLRDWGPALQRVITENQIPPELVQDFSAIAARAYQAALVDDDTVIDDLYTFLSQVGKDEVARLDRHHRIRAGQYATGAATRAATPSPPTGPATPAPPEAESPTPEQAIANATHYLRQRLRGT